MNDKLMISKSLCVYQDEAIGANPVPLAIVGKDLRINKSSDYFAKTGIKIDLQLNSTGEILQIQLGPEISVDLQTMKMGLEVGPMGLFPVHVLQLDKNFDSKKGGVLHFGFLKKIFIKQSLKFLLKRIFAKLIGLKMNKEFSSENDLSADCLKFFGNDNWGSFDITVKKNDLGEWAVYKTSSEKSIEKLVARFNVNKAGVVLGIQEMYCV